MIIAYKDIPKVRKKFKNLNRRIFKIKGKNSYERGAKARFYQVSKTVGVKVWNKLEEAMFAHSHQKKAHSHKLGPKVLSPVDVVLFIEDGDVESIRFGYRTEVAQKIISARHRRIYDQQNDDLYLALENLKMFFGDICEDNCGIIRGRLVCVDFGKESIS